MPNVLAVPLSVIDELANWPFVIPAVADKLDVVNPEIEPPKVMVPELVIVPPVNVIPDTVPDVATDVTVPLLVAFIVIAPDPETIDIPVPRVMLANENPDAVLPINICPTVALPALCKAVHGIEAAPGTDANEYDAVTFNTPVLKLYVNGKFSA